MVKIKDIRERLVKNPGEYLEVKLVVAKRVLAFSLFAYYIGLLFTIGGFSFSVFGFFVSIGILSGIVFHLYTILVIALSWFLFSLVEYMQHIYFPQKKWISIIGVIFAILFGLFGLAGHLGIFLF